MAQTSLRNFANESVGERRIRVDESALSRLQSNIWQIPAAGCKCRNVKTRSVPFVKIDEQRDAGKQRTDCIVTCLERVSDHRETSRKRLVHVSHRVLRIDRSLCQGRGKPRSTQ